jgi:hypothetical protein
VTSTLPPPTATSTTPPPTDTQVPPTQTNTPEPSDTPTVTPTQALNFGLQAAPLSN